VAALWHHFVPPLDFVFVSVKYYFGFSFIQFREYFVYNFSETQKQQKTKELALWHYEIG
jgi:hypothetical protein